MRAVWMWLLLLLAGCPARESEPTSGTDGDMTSGGESSTGDPGGVDPGDVALLGCGQAAWVRVDPLAGAYSRVYATPDGGSVVSGHMEDISGFVQGVLHRRGVDAQIDYQHVGAAPFGSELAVAGVADDGRYAVTETAFIDEVCEEEPFAGTVCTPIGTHWLRMFGPDDALLWEKEDPQRAFRALGVDPEGRVVVADPLEVRRYAASGDIAWTRPIPDATELTALAHDGGFFAFRYIASPATIARLDAELAVLWEVDPTTDFGIEGDNPPLYTLFAPVSDGGVAIAGIAVEGLRVIRLSPYGEELWRAELDVGPTWESALAAGPAGEVVVASLVPAPGGGVHGWLRLYGSDGVPSWTIECAEARWFESLIVDSTGVLAAGRLDHGVTNSQAFLAKYAPDTPDRPFEP